jgi:hypothetical protein
MNRTETRGLVLEEDTMSAQREVRVRVRPQFAALYPELATGVWVSAREFAQVIVARASQARRQSLHRRTLDLRHFEVRGAPERARVRRPALHA